MTDTTTSPTLEDVLAEIRKDGPTPASLMAVAGLVQEACKPHDVAVLLIDKVALSKEPDEVREARLEGMLGFIGSYFPEWIVATSPNDEPSASERC